MKQMRDLVLNELNNIKEGHFKVKHLVHSQLHAPQDYLISGKLSNIQSSLLYNLKCKGVNEFRSNFQSSIQHFECSICTLSDDTQEHALQCHGVRKHLEIDQRILVDSVRYDDLVGPLDRKLKITEAFQIIIKTRERLQRAPLSSLPGQHTGPRGL